MLHGKAIPAPSCLGCPGKCLPFKNNLYRIFDSKHAMRTLSSLVTSVCSPLLRIIRNVNIFDALALYDIKTPPPLLLRGRIPGHLLLLEYAKISSLDVIYVRLDLAEFCYIPWTSKNERVNLFREVETSLNLSKTANFTFYISHGDVYKDKTSTLPQGLYSGLPLHTRT